MSAAPVAIRPKLRIGSPGNRYELEADRVAQRVTQMPEERVQRSCGCGGGCGHCDEELVQRKSAAGDAVECQAAPSVVESTLTTPGTPLDAATLAFMEPRFGRDFSRVRVHADPGAAESADSISARAYTVGHHIVFGAGEYRPGSADGRRLLAHELTHVAQQDVAASLRDPIVQRDEKTATKPAPKSKGKGKSNGKSRLIAKTARELQQLEFKPAIHTPACACVVFVHHDEANARLMATLLHEHCRYNLAIVQKKRDTREINLPDAPRVRPDPNELFPQHVAEECWSDDQRCVDFVKANAGSKDPAVIRESGQRQFFVAIKQCSQDFTLPVVALHNNAIGDTARYKSAIDPKAKKPADIEAMRGKTFDDTLAAGQGKDNVLPYVELHAWLLKNLPKEVEKGKPTGNKSKLTNPKRGNLLSAGSTNIVRWCSVEDNSLCHIGDPERPNNVVWVTNKNDFDKLVGTKTNVALQTRVKDEDLSALFVRLPKISERFGIKLRKLEQAHDRLMVVWQSGGSIVPLLGPAIREILIKQYVQILAGRHLVTPLDPDALRYINVESPKASDDPDLRLKSYLDLKAVLTTLKLDCCETAPVPGQTESADQRVRQGLEKGEE